MSTPNDPMAEIRASFFIECEELLEALQDGLETIENNEADDETINVVFRAVHSVKGGAGAFGLTGLVQFAHRFETVLDQVRAGQMEVDVEVLKLFFQCADHLADLVRVSRDGSPLPETRTAELLVLLDARIEGGPTAEAENPEDIDFAPTMLALELDFDDNDAAPLPIPDTQAQDDLPTARATPPENHTTSAVYQINFAPHAELFETGNDPTVLLRNLGSLGDMVVTCDASQIPKLKEMSPEISHLSFHIVLSTKADEAEVNSIFEFVEGLCTLHIQTQDPSNDANGLDALTPTADTPIIATKPSSGKAAEPAAEPKTSALPEPQEQAKLTSKALQNPEPEARPEPTKSSPPKVAEKTANNAAKSIVRVDLDRIERLVNLVGELVINQAMLSQSLEQSGLSPHSNAMNGLEEFQRLTRDIQDSVMMIRAQPVKSLFQRMSRIVREASSAVGKDVRLQTDGETTEVDKTVIERLADPLTHMIRNAVDHGLESTSDRLASGKPAQGIVTLSAAHRSGRVVIEISDDGAGINRPKVLEIAVRKGLVPPDAQPTNAEIDNLLFLPGFSTATEVSDLSGRGVGMDVVRTEIQALGGRISISSEPGEGTQFSISLPLTLAVLDGMVIEVAGETLVLPLNLVIETVTLTENDVEMVRPGVLVVQVRNEFVPIIDLGRELGYRTALEDTVGSVVLLISHEDGNRAALLIDNIVDQRQVVIKGLDESLYRAPGIAAATILGDGQIALILDPSDIITQALSQEGQAPNYNNEGITA